MSDSLLDFTGIDWDELPDDDGPDDTIIKDTQWHSENRCKPVDYALKVTQKIIAVVDTETDPFESGLVVKPFALGFFDGITYIDFWGNDCVDQFFDYLATQTAQGIEYIIYAHNGGKFDFFFFLKYLDKQTSPLIINSRLVKIYFAGQEFRDSFAIIPQALGSYQKEKIDYDKFKKENREKHRAEILNYQRSDCFYTFDLIDGFHKMFGDKITIASASLPMLRSFTGFETLREGQDKRFREFYYGGRNQCFETGLLKPKHGKEFYLYDRNSMYPAAMLEELHPISNKATLQRDIDENTDFAYIDAINDGALPIRDAKGGLDFTVKRGRFHATIHEIRAGLETGTLRINRVLHAWAFDRKASFTEFVEHFYALRDLAKADNDLVKNILYKLILNSSYGKFALNPRKFKQYSLTIDEIPTPQHSPENPDGWKLEAYTGSIYIWSRPSPRKLGFYNVSTAASITGAARANLLRNIALAKRPIYCDTDSIICEGFRGELGKQLGQWDLEATGNRLAIAGKKMYALYNVDDLASNSAVKKASKGVRLELQDIVSVCNGNEIVYKNPVPTFNLDGSADFVNRKIRITG